MKNQRIAKFFAVFGLLAVSTLFPACESRGGDEKSTQKEESKPAITLATEVRKVLQGGKYREEAFRPVMQGVENADIRKTVEAEARECGVKIASIEVISLKLKLSSLMDKLRGEASKRRQKKILEGIQNELRQMAEEEGLKPH